MAEYQSVEQRFEAGGLNLRLPVDAMPANKYPYLRNVRGYFMDRLVPRPGLSQVISTTGSALHSEGRLNDPTPFASQPFLRLIGSGTTLYGGVSGAPSSIETGFSGDPLTMLPVVTEGTPQPWMFVADRNKFVKVRVDSTVYDVGITPPVGAPTAEATLPYYRLIDDMNAVGVWTPAGSVAGAISAVSRVNTTVQRILYDSGSTGWASIQLAAMTPDVQPGVTLRFAGLETDVVEEIKPALANNFIQSITYDSGSSGLCTIQPYGLGLGALDTPEPTSVRFSNPDRGPRDDEEPGLPRRRAGRARTYDAAANCMILLNGTEAVRILSVTVGPQGVQSFRCETAGTFAVNDTITGLASIRVHLGITIGAGDTVVTNMLQNVLTPPTPATASMTGGITKVAAIDLATVNTRPVQPDDEIHISIKLSNLSIVTQGRIYFDVDSATNDFTRNYYFFEFRPSDLTAAIQSTNTAATQTVVSARTVGQQRRQIDRRPTMDSGGTYGPVVPGDVTVDNPLSGAAGTPESGAVSGQIGAGQAQWAELRFKVRQLTRVGSDLSRTLANVQAMQILITAQATATLTVNYDALWLGGTFGPDVGTIGAPYIYCYRARSTVTGAKSNPSPAMRSGVIARRQGIQAVGTQHPDPQVDVLDWYRWGGSLPGWKFVQSTDNSNPPMLVDYLPDSAIAANPSLETDNFQPWPTLDLPRTGTCDVSGTAVTRVSGDTFNTSWAPGTVIQIDGIPYLLYAQPASTSLLEIVQNAGTLSGATFIIQEPVLLGTPLPFVWGDSQGFWFGCGDQYNPSNLFWTKGNQPEVTSDRNRLEVTPPSEPLQNGFVRDGRPYVFSTEQLYAINPSDGVSQFVASRTSCGRGLWSPWAMADGPAVAFLSKDGIYLTVGGESRSITDADLYPLFPHDGMNGVSVNGVAPPDMENREMLRLAWADDYLYFDYADADGDPHTLVFDSNRNAWFEDVYASAVGVRFHGSETGPEVRVTIAGGDNGVLAQMRGDTDLGTQIACHVRTGSNTLGNARLVKQFGDLYVDVDAAGGAGVTVQAGFDRFSTTVPSQVVNAGVNGRSPVALDLDSGDGVLATDVALDFTWVTATGVLPSLYLWQPSFLAKADATIRRATDWFDCGYAGAKFVQGLILRANTFGQTRSVQVQYDGGTVALTLSVNHNGEIEKAYPGVGDAWNPFIAHLVRLVPTDANDWLLLGWRWVFEPSPELVTRWITQPTTHDLSGYQHLFDGFIPYMATAPVTLTVTLDGAPYVYTLPSSGGAYVKHYLHFQPKKFRWAEYSAVSSSGFRVFERDMEIRVKAWGSSGPYSTVRPFGDVSRIAGARI